ncbi:hypothetical protein HMI54_011496, partial [Coelomomyces lativittatus]
KEKMSEENKRYTRSMTRELESRSGNVTPTIEGEEMYDDNEEIFYEETKKVPREPYPLEMPEGSGNTTRVKMITPIVRRELSLSHLPSYRGGDFLSFFREWEETIEIYGPCTEAEKLYYLPRAFSERLRAGIMKMPFSARGEAPNYEELVDFLFKLHDVSRQEKKSVYEDLREVINMKVKGEYTLVQYIVFFKSYYYKKRNEISEKEARTLFLEGLEPQLCRRIERKLTGPRMATLEDVIGWVDRYTIDCNGRRHEGLVFKEEAGNYTRTVREAPIVEQRNAFVKNRHNGPRNIPTSILVRECNACGGKDHLHGDCAALRKAILDKLIYRNERGRLCVVATGGEVRRPYGDTWITNARKVTEEKKKAVNHISAESRNMEVNQVYNQERTYQKTGPIMARERVEQKIVERIENSMISIPVKELLEHPGILYQMRGSLMNKSNQENKIAIEGNSIRRVKKSEEEHGIDRVVCRNIQLEVNGHQVKAMVDTGAEVNLISLDLAKLVGLEKRIEKVREGLYNADKSPMKVEGKLLGIRSKVLNKVRP